MKAITVAFEQGDRVWFLHKNEIVQGVVSALSIACKYEGYNSSGWGNMPSFPLHITYVVDVGTVYGGQVPNVYEAKLFPSKQALLEHLAKN